LSTPCPERRGAASRSAALLAAATAAPGFLDLDEATALYRAGRCAAASRLGPLVEIGSYRGRSALFLAAGIADAVADGHPTTVLFSIDHHRGSEEMQAGWPSHDPRIVDSAGRMDSLPSFRAAIESAGATDLIVAVVGDSSTVGRHLPVRCALVFLDGGHGSDVASADYRAWAPRVADGGLLVIHDVFEDPALGGRPPYECFREAIESGEFTYRPEASRRSLRVLVRTSHGLDDRLVRPR
jgi:hypothetical protein